MEKLIFNASMPRSGSELLQVLLHQNPRIYGSPTSPLLEYQYGARQNYELAEVKSQDSSMMQRAFISMCKGMADSYYSEVTERPIVCDKNRGWSHYYEWVKQWNPNPKMICAVRDIRSILGSMERIYKKNRHRPIGPDNPVELSSMTVTQRINHWLTTQPIGLALQRTHDLFQRNISDKILFIRYEDLTTNPASELTRIYEYINEPFDESIHNFSNIKKEVVEDHSLFGPYGNHSVHKEIVPYKHSDWSEDIPREVASAIRQQYAWYFDVFRY